MRSLLFTLCLSTLLSSCSWINLDDPVDGVEPNTVVNVYPRFGDDKFYADGTSKLAIDIQLGSAAKANQSVTITTDYGVLERSSPDTPRSFTLTVVGRSDTLNLVSTTQYQKEVHLSVKVGDYTKYVTVPVFYRLTKKLLRQPGGNTLEANGPVRQVVLKCLSSGNLDSAARREVTEGAWLYTRIDTVGTGQVTDQDVQIEPYYVVTDGKITVPLQSFTTATGKFKLIISEDPDHKKPLDEYEFTVVQ